MKDNIVGESTLDQILEEVLSSEASSPYLKFQSKALRAKKLRKTARANKEQMKKYVEEENILKEYIDQLQAEDDFEVEFAISGLDEILRCGVENFLIPKTVHGILVYKLNPFAKQAEELLLINRREWPFKCSILQKLHSHQSKFVRQKSKELYAKFANFKVHGKNYVKGAYE